MAGSVTVKPIYVVVPPHTMKIPKIPPPSPTVVVDPSIFNLCASVVRDGWWFESEEAAKEDAVQWGGGAKVYELTAREVETGMGKEAGS